MINSKWSLLLLLVSCFINPIIHKEIPREVLGAELSNPASPILVASLNPNFEFPIEYRKPIIIPVSSSTYKAPFYPIWWDGYEELRRACSCESWGTPELEPRQFREDGSLLRGYPNPNDVGACQISTVWWGKKAKELGLDIEGSYFDNIKFAKFILSVQGMDAWKYSKRCWNK